MMRMAVTRMEPQSNSMLCAGTVCYKVMVAELSLFMVCFLFGYRCTPAANRTSPSDQDVVTLADFRLS